MNHKIRYIPIAFLIVASLCIFILLHVNSLCVSNTDESGEWKAVSYCEFLSDPKKTWSGYICYFGNSEPPKTIVLKRTVEGETAIFTAEKEQDADSLLKAICFLSFAAVPKAHYDYMSFASSRPEKQYIEITWDDGANNTSIALE